MQTITNEYTTQRLLQDVLNKIFPNEKILKNARKEVELQNPDTGLFFEVDAWIPEKKLCFEFQDPHHYASIWYSQASLDTVRQNDYRKEEMLRNKDETLVHIPYWWSGDYASLMATIHHHRPDLPLPLQAPPIPLNAPSNIINNMVPGVGELMVASFPESPLKFENEISMNTWWIGEKYDGIRFCWNPREKQVYRRSGLVMQLPHALNTLFPSVFLDGEIWYGRSNFADTQKLIFQDVETINWSFFRSIIFDMPNPRSFDLPFEQRYHQILLDSSHPFMIPAIRLLCKEKIIFRKILQEILNEGGEGVLMRMHKSPYVCGRSTHLYKFKEAEIDAEALVLDDRSGIIWLQLPNEAIFSIESSSEPVAKGDIVTFTYVRTAQEAIPSSIVRIRKDVTWRDVVRNWHENVPLSERQGMALLAESTKSARTTNFRKIFENFAESKNFDFRVAENWYSALPALAKFKGAGEIAAEYSGSIMLALVDVFPEIEFQKSKFDLENKKYWTVANRRKFFTSIAKANLFDPLIPKNWYHFRLDNIHSIKGAWSVLAYYRGNPVEALLSLFPEIGLQRSKFKLSTFWDHKSNRRKFMEKFAEQNGFDPLVPENWYKVKRRDVFSHKGGRKVLAHYKSNLIEALSQLFPECAFSTSKFSVWSNIENGKSLLLKLAKNKVFDPLLPSNWYNVSRQDILALDGGPSFIAYFNGSHITALLSTFPDIGLQRSQFSLYSHWKISSNRKNFFLEFAQLKNFNPLIATNWYSVERREILATKGGRTVLEYYKGRLSVALMTLFPDIGLQKSEFKGRGNFGRRFFKKFAAERGFDPLNASNWHKIKRSDVCSLKEGKAVLTYYKGNFITALKESFPNISL